MKRLLILALLCLPAQADEIIIHGPSYHFDRDAGYNDSNYGLGYAWKNGLVAGTFYNSESHQTVYGAYRFNLYGNLGLWAGAATGYERAAVIPLIAVTYRVPITKDWALHLNFIPYSQGVLNLAASFKVE